MNTSSNLWPLSVVLLLAACSGGSGPPRDPRVSTDLSGTWQLATEIVDVDSGTDVPDLGLDGDVELVLHLDTEFDFYSATLERIAVRSLPNQPTSVELIHMPEEPQRVFFGGVYYLPSLDLTVELSGGLPAPDEFVADGEFAATVHFDVFDGDVMVVENIEGIDEWVVDDGAFLVCSGRVRVVGVLR